ncbi:hypothetical protein PR048_015214 [Dryococelus australis]|uniref:Uncharacterized protein n=1 Tax=Dryococelus australis TaxID=614101 RepID=A0ABQ9HGU2_9NEOP|nr:hypothetical protein PR048_015214 [Dryococelus australis]
MSSVIGTLNVPTLDFTACLDVRVIGKELGFKKTPEEGIPHGRSLGGAAYLQFLQDVLPEYLEEVPLDAREAMWFQQDGSRLERRQIAWPPRSPDITLPDFWLWRHMESMPHYLTRGMSSLHRKHLHMRVATCFSTVPPMWPMVADSLNTHFEHRHGTDTLSSCLQPKCSLTLVKVCRLQSVKEAGRGVKRDEVKKGGLETEKLNHGTRDSPDLAPGQAAAASARTRGCTVCCQVADCVFYGHRGPVHNSRPNTCVR